MPDIQQQRPPSRSNTNSRGSKTPPASVKSTESDSSLSWEAFLNTYARGLFPQDKPPRKPSRLPPLPGLPAAVETRNDPSAENTPTPTAANPFFLLAPPPPIHVESLRQRALYKYRWLWKNRNDDDDDDVDHDSHDSHDEDDGNDNNGHDDDDVRPQTFRTLTEMVKKYFDVEHTILSFILEDQAMFKLENMEDYCTSDRSISLCSHSILRPAGMVILDTHKDWRFRYNPNVTNAPHVRFYASANLTTREGYTIGALCIMSSTPRTTPFSPSDDQTLHQFASMLMNELDAWVLRKEVKQRERREEALADFAKSALVGVQPSVGDAYELACRLVAWSLDVEYVCIIEAVEDVPVGGGGEEHRQHHVPTSVERRVVGSNDPALMGRLLDMQDVGTYDLVTATLAGGGEFRYPAEGNAKLVPTFLAGLNILTGTSVPVPTGTSQTAPSNALLAVFTTDGRRLFDASTSHFLNAFAVHLTALLLRVKAESAATAKMAFMSSISHELRTPLHGLLGVSELLGATSLTGSQETFVSTIESCGKSLLGIVNNVLDIAKRSERSHHPPSSSSSSSSTTSPTSTFHPIDLFSVLQEVMDSIAATVPAEVELLLNIHLPPTTRYVKSDANCIRQIFTNLVGNALKFTKRGYVDVTVSPVPDSTPTESHTMLRFT
ncbi:His Kinase A domain containing protein, partial [Borealophlyctis nickersoniae]